MSDFTPQRYEPQGLPPRFASLHLFDVANLGSATNDHRLLVRQLLTASLRSRQLEAPEDLLDVSNACAHPSLNISISHTTDASLFGWVNSPSRLGVDVEERSRLKVRTVTRVCSKDELSLAPDPLLLWPAKEAAFKAVSPLATVLSHIEIHSWAPLDKERWSFQARTAQKGEVLDGYGEVRITSRHLLSFFLF